MRKPKDVPHLVSYRSMENVCGQLIDNVTW